MSEIYFNVYSNNNMIGYHNLIVDRDNNNTIVDIDINFNVKFLGFQIYKYSHINREVWIGNQLKTLESKTSKNDGEKLYCYIKRSNGRLKIDGTNGNFEKYSQLIPSSYWNYDLVTGDNRKKMINTQDCSLIDINITKIGTEKIYNNTLNAEKFNITGKEISGEEINIDIWYDENKNWVKMIFTKDENLIEYFLKNYDANIE